jgi:hypothetical protein
MTKDPVTSDYYVEPANVPLVDFRMLTSPDAAQRGEALALLDTAFREWGFVQICNHNIGPDKLHQAFKWVGYVISNTRSSLTRENRPSGSSRSPRQRKS